MTDPSVTLPRPIPRRFGRLLVTCAAAVLALRATVTACVLYDPEATPLVLDPGPTPTPAMTTAEWGEVLRKTRLREQADTIARSRGTVEQSSFDFLNGGTYVKVVLEGVYGSKVHHYVRKGDRISVIAPGPEGRNQIVNQFDLSVKNPETALRYVRWLLDVTSEGPFWLVGSGDDLPLRTVNNPDDKALAERVRAARSEAEAKIEPPRAQGSESAFMVYQDAVAGRDLVRYTVRVTRLGLPSIETKTLVKDLPVVGVGSG
jgi:hypothetical protein